MTEGTSNRTLAAGVAVSVLLHVAGAVAFLAAGSSARGGGAYEPPDSPTRPLVEEQIQLGDPESRAIPYPRMLYRIYP